MRYTRIMAAAVTTVALALPGIAVSTASAESAQLKHREFQDTKIVNITPQRLQMRTKVVQYQNKPTSLQKKDCRVGCAWHRVQRAKTNQFGRVRYEVPAPADGRWFWRIVTPKRGQYATSYSPVWYTETT